MIRRGDTSPSNRVDRDRASGRRSGACPRSTAWSSVAPGIRYWFSGSRPLALRWIGGFRVLE